MKKTILILAIILISGLVTATNINQEVGFGEAIEITIDDGITVVVINPSDLPDGQTIIVNINMSEYYNKTQIDKKFDSRLTGIENRIGVVETNITSSSYKQEIKMPILWIIIIIVLALLVLFLFYMILVGGEE